MRGAAVRRLALGHRECQRAPIDTRAPNSCQEIRLSRFSPGKPGHKKAAVRLCGHNLGAKSLINLERWIGDPNERGARLRQAFQTAVAACLAYLATEILQMPQGFWAVLTAILVTQANVGASLGVALDRLLGSLLGVVVGGSVAVLIAHHQEFKYPALAVTVAALAFFSARRAPLRIACVTAAIVILGDPRFGPALSSAGNRMVEVLIGTVISLLTTLMLFPSRAGPAFADQVARTLPLLFGLLADTLSLALGAKFDDGAMRTQGDKIRTAFAASEALSREAKLEVAGHLADHADTDAVIRTMRRLWHTEIMLLRAVTTPLPPAVIERLRPDLERLRDAAAALPQGYAESCRGGGPPDLTAVETALSVLEQGLSQMREKGELRSQPMDDVIRLLAFDFALGQLRGNLQDLAGRSEDLAAFTGAAIPWMRRLRGLVRIDLRAG